jgi:hypothetical protein
MALALAAAGATACRDDTNACTLIGCAPSLQVASANLPPNQTVEVCVGTSCVLANPVGGVSFGEIVVDSAVADVRVIVREDGAIVAEQRRAVPTTELQPNGPKCAPTCKQVTVQVGPGGFR